MLLVGTTCFRKTRSRLYRNTRRGFSNYKVNLMLIEIFESRNKLRYAARYHRQGNGVYFLSALLTINMMLMNESKELLSSPSYS